MAFIERFTSLKSAVPFRCYIDDNELNESFGSIENARKYIFSLIEKHKEMFEGRDYLIAAVYGLEKKKIAEIFGYKVMGDSWPGNTDNLTWIFEDGEHLPTEKWSCENVDIARGEEGKHRRKTANLEDFLRTVPHLAELQPLKDAGIVEYKP